jgi:hypothetical protein
MRLQKCRTICENLQPTDFVWWVFLAKHERWLWFLSLILSCNHRFGMARVKRKTGWRVVTDFPTPIRLHADRPSFGSATFSQNLPPKALKLTRDGSDVRDGVVRV